MMLLEIFGFLRLSFADILDILLVALIIYQVFRWIRGSSVISSIFMAILALYVLRVVVAALDMRLMSAILGTVLDVGVIALIVIFQPEIRRILTKFGSSYGITARGKSFLNRILGTTDTKLDSEAVKELTEACRSMSLDKTGALIVIQHETRLDYIIDTGDRIDANINRRLIMNLFFKNSPLHDGAVIINDGRVVAARCTLPITEKTDIPPSFGMRHKAAIGISEETDADVIVVSEETGNISFVKGGQVKRIGNINELKLLLTNSFSDQKAGDESKNAGQ
ncbi:MAG: TIGR00159 family protein [Bacteroidetes bacterium]|uniref:Diadenylate cyclase n=1 Tax=Candidatus Cryptobacteroides faecipullorum TaxID=2840764 RepID=A0A9D9NAS8_9BACT|nr:TIGR00159 family protein [Candidatus Cryptobacteroides faecipullorum]